VDLARQLVGSRRGRLLAAAFDAGLGFARSAARGLHGLWLEITGFFFLVFAGLGAVALWREAQAPASNSTRLLLTLAFTLMFAWFGVTSFRRARQKR
jgi:hypothetical protein